MTDDASTRQQQVWPSFPSCGLCREPMLPMEHVRRSSDGRAVHHRCRVASLEAATQRRQDHRAAHTWAMFAAQAMRPIWSGDDEASQRYAASQAAAAADLLLDEWRRRWGT